MDTGGYRWIQVRKSQRLASRPGFTPAKHIPGHDENGVPLALTAAERAKWIAQHNTGRTIEFCIPCDRAVCGTQAELDEHRKTHR